MGQSVPNCDVCVASVLPSISDMIWGVANVEMGQSRHFAMQKNSEPFAVGPP
jgi:hypothetical protein